MATKCSPRHSLSSPDSLIEFLTRWMRAITASDNARGAPRLSRG
ncbi:hypothetical protein FBY35_1273 [Streptomyces sp. SLBN-118]|nr:hypothetical protein FBY35_1273 [Streptomyces sp. SLBN-118]